MPELVLSPRIRSTPFTCGVEAAAPVAYTVYNHMRLPSVFGSLEGDCAHLKEHVQVWDVAVQRQVEIAGPDASRLVQWMTPRDISNVDVGVCAYVPICDESGGMLNDPVALHLSRTRWWLSLADSDLLLYAKGLVIGAGLDVSVREPDISPLAVQGPKAEELVARVFGDAIRNIRRFRFDTCLFDGNDQIVARSGWSKQGGFEIYVDGHANGMPIFNALMEAGRDLNVRVGCPNTIERLESGLLSYGSDITREHTPYQAGLGAFCYPEAVACIGREALLREARDGPPRQIRCVSVGGGPAPPLTDFWQVIGGGRRIGRISSAAWSPEFQTNVAIGMIDRSHWKGGTLVEVHAPDGIRAAEIREAFYR